MTTTTEAGTEPTTLTTTTVAPTTTAPTTSTTQPGSGATTTSIGSGLGAGGVGTVNPDGTISDTGGESMIGLGLGLFAVALVLRRASRLHRA